MKVPACCNDCENMRLVIDQFGTSRFWGCAKTEGSGFNEKTKTVTFIALAVAGNDPPPWCPLRDSPTAAPFPLGGAR